MKESVQEEQPITSEEPTEEHKPSEVEDEEPRRPMEEEGE